MNNIPCILSSIFLTVLLVFQQPLAINKVDTKCCWSCKKGPVSLTFKCARSGAVIGENFMLRGEVMNQGRDEIQKTSVTLFQVRSLFLSEYDNIFQIRTHLFGVFIFRFLSNDNNFFRISSIFHYFQYNFL